MLKLTFPAAAAGGSRVVQLAVLMALLTTAPTADRATLVAGFGVMSAFAIFTDSGGAPYLLQTPRDRLGRGLHARATAFHLLLATTGAAAALGAIALSPGARTGMWSVLVALAVSGVCDSVTRTTRAPLLVERRDAAYAAPEAVLVLGKVPLLVWAFAASSPLPLIGLAVVSAVVLAATVVCARAGLSRGVPLPRRVYAHILEFGVSGSLSSLYSQAPLVIGTLLIGVTAVEPLAVAYRLVQPLEFLPATVAAQLMPRLRAGAVRALPWLAVFVSAAAVVAAALALISLPLDTALGGALTPAIFLVIAASVLPKWTNYFVVAVAMAWGFIVQRLVATAVVAVVAIAGSIVSATAGGVTALAWVTVGCELLLLALLGTLVRTRARTRLAVFRSEVPA